MLLLKAGSRSQRRKWTDALFPAHPLRSSFPMLALACEIDGNRYRHGMRVSDLVTLDSDDKKAPACNIPNNSRA